jgi:hypothetical protein
MHITTFKSIPPVSVLNLLKAFGFDMSDRAGGACMSTDVTLRQDVDAVLLVDATGHSVPCVSPELFAKTVYATETSLNLTLFQ